MTPATIPWQASNAGDGLLAGLSVMLAPAAERAGEGRRIGELAQRLERWLGRPVSLLSTPDGRVLHAGMAEPSAEWSVRTILCQDVARRGRPEPIEDDGSWLVMAVPTPMPGDEGLVAICSFLVRPLEAGRDAGLVAARFGLDDDAAQSWIVRNAATTPADAERTCQLTAELLAAQRLAESQEAETAALSAQLGAAFDEISLLYQLAHQLKLSGSIDDLAGKVADWLEQVLPGATLAIRLEGDIEVMDGPNDGASGYFTRGACPFDRATFDRFTRELGPDARQRVTLLDDRRAEPYRDEFPLLAEAVLVPLGEGGRHFGWLAAFENRPGTMFGPKEAGLLGSIGAILGVHCANLTRFREQTELLTGVVRALTSAIDAKDPYTRGHSDRVARISVALGRELGLDDASLRTLQLAGMLHDVGKIGVDDEVLRKPGKLTETEFEHIKTHTEIGYRILRDLKQMAPVLPVVLHHHESWDGRGYPCQLAGEQIPLFARIVAVADAYDAMASDRPYRRGMPDGQLDKILRQGQGRQWDGSVIEALFQVREEIREISRSEPIDASLDQVFWT